MKPGKIIKSALFLSITRILLITYGLMMSAEGFAATYYVSTTGNDSSPTGSSAAPYRHLTRAASAATKPGDTVIVMDGTYDNEGQVDPNNVVRLDFSGQAAANGQPANPITFKAEHRGKAILDGGATTTADACDGAYAYFDLSHAHDIVIQGFVIQHGCAEGIHSNDDAHDVLIRWNEIAFIANRNITSTPDNGRDGIFLNENEYNFTFDGNIFHDIGRIDQNATNGYDHGIYTHAMNTVIINNVFYNSLNGWHIQTSSGVSGVFANNTFYGPNMYNGLFTQDGQIMLWQPASGDVTIRNNIFYNSRTHALAISGFAMASGVCNVDNNIVFGAGVTMNEPSFCSASNNRLNTDPLFVNAGNHDFHLQSMANSPAKDTGVTVALASTDFDGNPRPQGKAYDIGAFELVQGAIFSLCDVSQDRLTNVVDVQLEINQALSLAACTADINLDGKCNIIDVQRVVNAALSGVCVSP